jgi:predicted transposase YbfD/YdcC
MFAVLLDQISDLEGTLVTADALHAQVAHLNYLHERGAHLLVCVKGNQPTLRKTLRGQPWKDIPVGHTESGRSHGRIEKRTMKVVTVEAGLGFPHTTQAIQIVRRSRPITPGKGKRAKWRNETVYAITSLTADEAHPDELARWIRGHWCIEVRLHWVRDVTLGEDLHQARTGSGPHVLATCRNLIISLLRLTDHTNIASALRHHARHTDQAVALVVNENPKTVITDNPTTQ